MDNEMFVLHLVDCDYLYSSLVVLVVPVACFDAECETDSVEWSLIVLVCGTLVIVSVMLFLFVTVTLMKLKVVCVDCIAPLVGVVTLTVLH
jgi:hypothetical protein